MLRLREVYDIERRRLVKNLPLLQLLKAQIDEVGRVTTDLQQAELEENWVNYEKLQQLLTQLLLHQSPNTSTEQINSDDDFVLTAPIPIRQQEPTVATRTSDDDFVSPEILTNNIQLRPASDTDSDDDFVIAETNAVDQQETVPANGESDDDFVIMETISVEKGKMFASVPELQSELQILAKANNYMIRREKDSIVCSNAGSSTWSRVTNTKALADRRRRQRLKETQDDFAFLDDSQDEQEDKVRPTDEPMVALHYAYIPFQTPLTCSNHNCILGNSEKDPSQNFNTLWMFMARTVQDCT
jgi:hypothetical protein